MSPAGIKTPSRANSPAIQTRRRRLPRINRIRTGWAPQDESPPLGGSFRAIPPAKTSKAVPKAMETRTFSVAGIRKPGQVLTAREEQPQKILDQVERPGSRSSNPTNPHNRPRKNPVEPLKKTVFFPRNSRSARPGPPCRKPWQLPTPQTTSPEPFLHFFQTDQSVLWDQFRTLP